MSDSQKTQLKAIVAMASNRIIGKEGALPWQLPEDLKWFKKLTLGSPIVMGRKTMDSIGHPLPKRRNVVISRTLSEVPKGFELIHSCEDIVEHFPEEDTVWVIGGAEIYQLTLALCDEIYLSYVHHPYEGDTSLVEFEDGFQMEEIVYQDDDFELRRYIRKK